MFNTLDLNALPVSFKAVIVEGELFINATSTEALSFKAGLASMGMDCTVILLDVCRFKLIYVSSRVADN